MSHGPGDVGSDLCSNMLPEVHELLLATLQPEIYAHFSAVPLIESASL